MFSHHHIQQASIVHKNCRLCFLWDKLGYKITKLLRGTPWQGSVWWPRLTYLPVNLGILQIIQPTVRLLEWHSMSSLQINAELWSYYLSSPHPGLHVPVRSNVYKSWHFWQLSVSRKVAKQKLVLWFLWTMLASSLRPLQRKWLR